MPTQKERIATLEQQNLDAETGRKEVRQDIKDIRKDVSELKVGQNKAQTTLDLLVTNGRGKPVALMDKAKAVGTPLISGGGFVAILMLLLDRL